MTRKIGALAKLFVFLIAILAVSSLLVSIGVGITPATGGNHTVSDSDRLLRTGNSTPTASRDSPTRAVTLTEGDSITFSLEASDVDGDLRGTEWFFDGTFETATHDIDGSSGTATWSRTFDSPGTHTVQAEVFDSEWGYSKTVDWTITVEKNDGVPTASRDSPDRTRTIQVGESVTFSLTASDANGDLRGTEWYVEGAFETATYGIDGPSGTATWSRTFDSPGTYTVEGLAFDSEWGYSSAIDWVVTVEKDNRSPMASRDGPGSTQTISVGESVTFSLATSDRDGNLRGTEWFFDGTFETATHDIDGSSGTATWSRTFDSPGTHTVKAEVFDSEWGYSKTVDWTIDVRADGLSPSFRDRGVYVWGATLPTGGGAADRFFARMNTFDIGTVYVSWGALETFPASERASFIERAHSQNLQVHALIGTIGSDGPRKAEHAIPDILAYNDGRPGDEQFDGIHLDAEPSYADLQTFLGNYRTTLDGIRTNVSFEGETIDSQGMALSAAIGWWWSDLAPNTTRALVEHPSFDHVVVMAYHDTTAGVRNRTAMVVTGTDTPYAVAVETQEFPKDTLPESHTFYEEGRDAATDALSQVADSPPSPGHLGGVLHFYQSSVSKWDSLQTATLDTSTLEPGGSLSLNVSVVFGDTFPESSHGSRLVARLSGNAETYSTATKIAPPGAETTRVLLNLSVPDTAPAGSYDVTLLLNDTTIENSDREAIEPRTTPITIDTLAVGSVSISDGTTVEGMRLSEGLS